MDQKEPKRVSEQQIKSLIDRARMIGYPLIKIPTHCDHECILISTNSNNHIIYIPDAVTHLNEDSYTLTFTEYIQNLQGCIRVAGGHNLIDISYMFSCCKAQSLDLSNLDTSKVISMQYMFNLCAVESLDLSSFDTRQVKNMYGIFLNCQAESIDLSGFNTSSATDMRHMFYSCKVQSLDLSSFDTSNVTDMHGMFAHCNVQYLDLSTFDTSKVTNMRHMFSCCKAEYIDLSSFNVNISNLAYMEYMFDQCNAKIKTTDPKIIECYSLFV